METFVPQGYSGAALPSSITTLLYTLVQHGFQCEATGSGKTITVTLNHTPRGYVKRYVLQRRGSLGYYLDPLGLDGQRCPAEDVNRLRERFCERHGCDPSDLIEHPLGGTNKGTSLFIIRHPDLALRVLLHDAGISSDEFEPAPTLREKSGAAGGAGLPSRCVDVRSHEPSHLDTLVREPEERSVSQSDVCSPPAADGSPRIPFLKDFSDRHNLRYEPKPSHDGLPEVYVYTHDMVYRYAFARWWDDQGPLVLWVGVNPAKGDTEQRYRPTLDRCIDRSRERGAAGLIFANLFAARHNQPSGLRSTPDPIGPHNDEALAELSKIAGWTIAAWGRQDALGRARARVVRRLLVRPLCLGVTVSGDPRHPLYVAGSVPLEPWSG